MNNRKNKSRLGIALSVAAGAVAGWWLNSEKGRKFRKDTAEKAVEIGAEVKETTKEQISNLSSSVKDAANRSQNFVANASDSIKSGLNQLVNSTEETIDEGQNAFKNGSEKAKQKIKQIEKVLEN